jgi:hypothetical protein
MITFGFVCFSTPPFRRRASQELPTVTQRTRTNLDDRNSRIEFVIAKLPYRTADEADGDDDSLDVNICCDKIVEEATNNSTPDTCRRKDKTIKTRSAEAHVSSMVSCKGCNPSVDCSICLCPYNKGDEVSWSTNPFCPHEYHRLCIQHWLISHEECPMCRNVFLLCEPAATTRLMKVAEVREEPIQQVEGSSHAEEDETVISICL